MPPPIDYLVHAVTIKGMLLHAHLLHHHNQEAAMVYRSSPLFISNPKPRSLWALDVGRPGPSFPCGAFANYISRRASRVELSHILFPGALPAWSFRIQIWLRVGLAWSFPNLISRSAYCVELSYPNMVESWFGVELSQIVFPGALPA